MGGDGDSDPRWRPAAGAGGRTARRVSPDAWRAWLDRHGPALLLFARQWSATRADAEDAVQDGFVRFWQSKSAGGGAGRIRDEVAYLYACVRTAALDLSRSGRRRHRREEAAAAPEASLETCPDPLHDERREAVERAMAELPAEQREVLVMKVWGGLTFAQVGEALDISPNTAASRHRYALQRLSQQLAEVGRE